MFYDPSPRFLKAVSLCRSRLGFKVHSIRLQNSQFRAWNEVAYEATTLYVEVGKRWMQLSAHYEREFVHKSTKTLCVHV